MATTLLSLSAAIELPKPEKGSQLLLPIFPIN